MRGEVAWFLGAALSLVAGFAAPALGQTDIPRTADGRPDFQGLWESRWLTPVERSAGVDRLVVDEAEAGRLARQILDRAAQPSQMDPELAYPDAETLAVVRGEYRTSLVIDPPDGRLPMNEAGRSRMRAYLGGLDGPEQRMTTERCIGGVGWAPLQIRTASMVRRLVQTRDHLVIHSEAYSDVRAVPLGELMTPAGFTQNTGVSRSSWDGDALVVETSGFTPHLSTHGIVTVLSPQAQIRERFAFASPDEIVYTYTVTDPAYYARPWTAEYSLRRTEHQVFEFACHEGNYSMTHMLQGARVMERREAAAAKK